MSNLVFEVLQPKEHNTGYDHTAYFKELISDYYPARLQELESLHHNMVVMDDKATVPQLFVEKLMNEIKTLWRAEKHYWQRTDDVLHGMKFPKDYIVTKQKTIRDLITHLRNWLFTNGADNKSLLDVLSDYIEIEYKLNALLIEKERRIYEISARETH